MGMADELLRLWLAQMERRLDERLDAMSARLDERLDGLEDRLDRGDEKDTFRRRAILTGYLLPVLATITGALTLLVVLAK